MRLFVAVRVPLPEPLRTAALGVLAGTRHRPAPEANAHVTLAFLGDDVTEAQIPELEGAIEKTLAGRGRMVAMLNGMGAFPSHRRARVLWAGLDAPGLPELAGRIAGDCARWHAPDTRPFRAHLTLARLDPARDLRIGLAPWEHRTWWQGTLDRVDLVRSDARRGRPPPSLAPEQVPSPAPAPGPDQVGPATGVQPAPTLVARGRYTTLASWSLGP